MLPDPISIFTAIGGAQLAAKVLGPSAEYLGEGIRDVLAKRQTNTKRILENAEKKLGDKVSKPGQVPPRVIKEVIDEGSFCDDEVTLEYFGGVLASSRTDSSRDDRGVAMMKLISRLPTYQLRTHYLLYTAVRYLLSGSEINFGSSEDCRKAKTYIPIHTYLNGMGLTQNEVSKINTVQLHALAGLYREGLISDWRSAWKVADLGLGDVVSHPGLTFIPTTVGVELFLSAYGLADIHPSQFLQADINIKPMEGVEFDAEVCKIV